MRILVATDGSNDAKAAVGWLKHLPLPADRIVMAITVVSPPIPVVNLEKAEKIRAALIADARRLADDTASELLSSVATGRVVEGDAREEILAAAREWRADLIVIGARGLTSRVARFFLGSVSLAVARHAPCPVLVCKSTPRDVHAITVALDGSEHARHALDWLIGTLPAHPGVRLKLLGVTEPQHYPTAGPGILGTTLRAAVAAVDAERRAALEAELSEAAKTLRAQAPAIETAVVTGKPADAIVRDIERCGTDLVVLGARGASAVTRLVLGSVSEAVLHHAPCPVLIVRPRETQS
jgi:nucleotide-binding universal stress UspA family protein